MNKTITPGKFAAKLAKQEYYKTKVKPKLEERRRKKKKQLDKAKELRINFFIECEKIMDVAFLSTHKLAPDIEQKLMECFVEEKSDEISFEDQ